MADQNKKVECTIPVLAVKNLKYSIAFYTDKLGFTLDWGDEAGSSICSVSRDGKPIMLREANSGFGSWVWIGVEDGPMR